MYAYHTDAHGIYNEQKSLQVAPRLQGWLKTDADGRYEYRSIRPAHIRMPISKRTCTISSGGRACRRSTPKNLCSLTITS
jgi:protocatechuate 3,4-dioxygenase beta subunit